ncbi:hypothetical protein G9A89_014460 [Geosiphon pyriformis]|nr:hypothetical protein G9A89_014460 [Geosiphon pyriformis]
MSTQTPIFAVGLIVEDVLEKNRELSSRRDPKGEWTSFLAARVFVDDTIWIGNSRTAIQNILNIAIKFIENSSMNGNNAVVCHFTPSKSLYNFGFTNKCLAQFGSGIINIYTNGSVKNLGSVDACDNATTYFLCANLDVSVRVYSLLSLTLAELQTIALALDCVPALSSVVLHTDSQAFLDICAFLDCFVNSNFHEKCWIKKEHICSAITSKNLSPKSFVIKNWVNETMSVLGSGSDRETLIINMVCNFAADHRSAIWVPNARLKAYYEKHSLLPRNGSLAPAVSELASQ